MTGSNLWPVADQIRWVECRLHERIGLESGAISADVPLSSDLPRKNLEVWLAKVRDGHSWQRIVIDHLPEYLEREGLKKSAGVSMARRLVESVERELNPTPSETLQQWIDGRIADLFHCTPQQFKKYLSTMPGDRAKKK